MQCVQKIRGSEMIRMEWGKWKEEVLYLMRTKYRMAFGDIKPSDMDWEAWKEMYDDELAPDDAILEEISAGQWITNVRQHLRKP